MEWPRDLPGPMHRSLDLEAWGNKLQDFESLRVVNYKNIAELLGYLKINNVDLVYRPI